MEEKKEFNAQLRKVFIDVPSDEKLVLCEDLNAHVGAKADGFAGVQECHDYRSRNPEGEMFLECSEAMSLIVTNT